jgi:hypothetical protein
MNPIHFSLNSIRNVCGASSGEQSICQVQQFQEKRNRSRVIAAKITEIEETDDFFESFHLIFIDCERKFVGRRFLSPNRGKGSGKILRITRPYLTVYEKSD